MATAVAILKVTTKSDPDAINKSIHYHELGKYI